MFSARLRLDDSPFLVGQGNTADEAVSDVFARLHFHAFGQAIDPSSADRNFHEYTDAMGFRACCLGGFNAAEDFRPTAMMLWSALQRAAHTLHVQVWDESTAGGTKKNYRY